MDWLSFWLAGQLNHSEPSMIWQHTNLSSLLAWQVIWNKGLTIYGHTSSTNINQHFIRVIISNFTFQFDKIIKLELSIISTKFLPTSCTSFIRVGIDSFNVLWTKSDTCNQEIICVDHITHIFVEMSFSLRFANIYIFFFVHFILSLGTPRLLIVNEPRYAELLLADPDRE